MNFFTENLNDKCTKAKKLCLTPHQKPIISLSDKNSSTLRIENKERKSVYTVKTDGCLIKGNKKKRCDWVLYCKEQNKLFFIELKKRKLKENDIIKKFEASVEFWEKNNATLCYILVHYGTKRINKLAIKLKRNMNMNILSITAKKQPQKPPTAEITLTELLKKN